MALVEPKAVRTVLIKDIYLACKQGFAGSFDKAVKGLEEEKEVVIRLANSGLQGPVWKRNQLYSLAKIVAL
jgi:hypothetical protein